MLLVQSESRLGIFVALVGGLGVLYGVVYGPLAAFWSELFDTSYRYTALSTLYQVSGVVASGLTPLVAAWLVARGDGTLWWSRRTPWAWRWSAWSRSGCCRRRAGPGPRRALAAIVRARDRVSLVAWSE